MYDALHKCISNTMGISIILFMKLYTTYTVAIVWNLRSTVDIRDEHLSVYTVVEY